MTKNVLAFFLFIAIYGYRFIFYNLLPFYVIVYQSDNYKQDYFINLKTY